MLVNLSVLTLGVNVLCTLAIYFLGSKVRANPFGLVFLHIWKPAACGNLVQLDSSQVSGGACCCTGAFAFINTTEQSELGPLDVYAPYFN